MNSLTLALMTEWPWRPVTTLLLLLLALGYVLGWQRTRQAYPLLASRRRLALFAAGLFVVSLAMISPLYSLHESLLSARSAQQILLMLVAPPLLWLSCPVHMMVWGLPSPWRRMVTRRLFLADSTGGKIWRFLTRPSTAWLITLAVFLLWHDPRIASWSLANTLFYNVGLWLILGAYMLFWWHVVGTAPRIHRELPIWLGVAYVLVGGEVVNMATGVILAFRDTPAYAYYSQQAGGYGLTPMTDQMVSGGMIWFIGSLIYIGAIIGMLGRFFQHGDAPPRMPIRWEATERSIAPGLEGRVIPDGYRQEQEYE